MEQEASGLAAVRELEGWGLVVKELEQAWYLEVIGFYLFTSVF